jgi:hypothetical protein
LHVKFLERSWQNFVKNLIYTGRCNLPRIAISATGHIFDCRNSQIANRLEPFNGPLES